MIIYVVVRSENYEGSTILGVYSTLKKAKSNQSKEDDIIKWRLDGNEIVQRVKNAGKKQFEANIPFLRVFTPNDIREKLGYE